MALGKQIRMPQNERGQLLAVFIPGLLLCILDRLTKWAFVNQFPAGTAVPGADFGLFRFTIVHNTGAAWGLFGNSTQALGWLSVVVSGAIIAYVLATHNKRTILEACFLSLVVSGGIGNAIDRLNWGFVLDFIQIKGINFPVFNIADIGITLGFVIFII